MKYYPFIGRLHVSDTFSPDGADYNRIKFGLCLDRDSGFGCLQGCPQGIWDLGFRGSEHLGLALWAEVLCMVGSRVCSFGRHALQSQDEKTFELTL